MQIAMLHVDILQDLNKKRVNFKVIVRLCWRRKPKFTCFDLQFKNIID